MLAGAPEKSRASTRYSSLMAHSRFSELDCRHCRTIDLMGSTKRPTGIHRPRRFCRSLTKARIWGFCGSSAANSCAWVRAAATSPLSRSNAINPNRTFLSVGCALCVRASNSLASAAEPLEFSATA